MTKQEKTVYKKMGRPPGVVYTETVLVRLPKDAATLITEWARQQQPEVKTRSEAVRRLLMIALNSQKVDIGARQPRAKAETLKTRRGK